MAVSKHAGLCFLMAFGNGYGTAQESAGFVCPTGPNP
jgi:hypothetical protein